VQTVIRTTQWSKNGLTHYSDKRENWRGERSPYQISRLSGQKCGNTAPKTVKNWNFAHNLPLSGHSFKILHTYLYASIGSF